MIARLFSHLGKAERLRAKGDAARDKGDWTNAARFYRWYLSVEPKAAEIWVQFGHSLKENGDLDSAGKAYATALRLDPTKPDTHLQIGHLYKLRADEIAAMRSYKSALRLDPGHPEATRELRDFGISELELAWIAAPAESRGAELERRLVSIKEKFDRIGAELVETKALHVEMQRQKDYIARLRSELKIDVARLTDQIADAATHNDEPIRRIASQIGEVSEAVSKCVTEHADLRRQMASNLAHVKSEATFVAHLGQQQSIILKDITALKEEIAAIVAHTDDPLQALVVQFGYRLETLTERIAELTERLSLLEERSASADQRRGKLHGKPTSK